MKAANVALHPRIASRAEQVERQDRVRMQDGIDFLQGHQSSRGQSRAHQQHQRQRNLRGNERQGDAKR